MTYIVKSLPDPDSMILGFRDRRTRRFAEGDAFPAFQGFKQQADKRLRLLEAAVTIADLAALPSNHFEALKGDRKGQFSIRINQQWRICFEWPTEATGASNVEIVDYH